MIVKLGQDNPVLKNSHFSIWFIEPYGSIYVARDKRDGSILRVEYQYGDVLVEGKETFSGFVSRDRAFEQMTVGRLSCICERLQNT